MVRPPAHVRHRYAEVAKATVAKRAADCYERGEFDRESWEEVAAEGLWRLAVPRRRGGCGGTWWDFAAAFEGIAAGGRDLGFNLSLVAHAGLIRSLLTYGHDEQVATYLPTLLDGGIGATALTETRGGSDVARTTTAATRTAGGFRLSGAKDHITHGPVADLVLVLARVPEVGSRDITLFLVEGDAPGVRRGEVEDMIGNRTSPTGPVAFEDVPLPPGAVLGPVGDGLAIIYDTISLDRLLYGILSAAYLEPILSDAIEYACQREAFGSAIADYQYVQGRLTDLKFGIETTRWTSYAALEALLEEQPEANLLCSVAKYTGSETLRSGTEHAFRILGHVGYMAGGPARWLVDGLGPLIAGGTSEMQRKNVFNQMMAMREEVVA